MTRFPLLTGAFAVVLLGAWLAAARPAASPAPPGPHAVIEMHEKLFAALDRGDANAAAAFLAGDRKAEPRTVTMYLLDGKGAPVKAADAGEARDLLKKLAAESERAGGTWKTTLTHEQADCYSPELSYAILELERAHTVEGKTDVERFRSTSLVRYEDEGWKIFHWHVSPAETRAPAVSTR